MMGATDETPFTSPRVSALRRPSPFFTMRSRFSMITGTSSGENTVSGSCSSPTGEEQERLDALGLLYGHPAGGLTLP